MNDHLTTIRTKHLESCSSYDAEPQKKSYSVRRRAGFTAASAKNIVTEPTCPVQEPLRRSGLHNRSDKSIRGRILLPKSKHLPQNFFDDRLFLRLDRNSSRHKEQSPKQTNVDTPTFRQLGDITFCEEFKKSVVPQQEKKFGKSEVLRRKQAINEDKENQPFLANIQEKPRSLRSSMMLKKPNQSREAYMKQGGTIFQPKVSLFEEQQLPTKQRLVLNPSETRTRRLKIGSYLPQLKLRNIV